jgi:tetratricopeptide (TPR) repeat protein
LTDEDDFPTQITTHGDFSPGYVGGDYKVTLRGYRKPRTAPPFILPQQKTSDFVGRLDQLDKLEEILLKPSSHKMAGIVGLAGTGGIGKSALACQFAEKHREKFPDGVIGIRLDSKKDVDTIAREFARLDGEVLDEDDTRNASAIMQDLFAEKRILLIIDNAETADIRELHPGGQTCAIIVTTRDRSLPSQIEIPDKQLIDLPVLANPESLALLAQFIDEQKFYEEADAINKILVLVGNLPLAIEIVGKTLQNRLKHYPTFKIADYAEALDLDKLELRRDKHFNVRLCFQRSITYLEEDNRGDLIDAFAQLSVCATSGFAFHTAMAAIGVENEHKTEENLQELVDLSLLNKAQADSQRFIFHPLLQEFSGELAIERYLLEKAKQNHTNYFVNRVRNGNVDELEADLDDIINVAEWMAETKNEGYVKFYLDLRTLFNRLGHWQRANKIIDVFLRLSEENGNWLTLAQFHIQQAKFLLLQGDFSKSEKMLLDVQEIINKIEQPFDQKRTEAMRLNTVGGAYQRQSKFNEAVDAFQRSYELLEKLDDDHGQAMVLNSLGGVLQRQGNFDDAVNAFQRSYELLVELGDDRGQAMVLNSLGGVLQRQGKLDEAANAFQKSYELLVELGDQRGQAMVLNSLSGVLQRQGNFNEAAKTLQKGVDIEEKLGNERGQAMILNSLGGLLQRQGNFEKAVEALQKSAKIEEKIGNRHGQAKVLNSLGGVYQRQGEFDEAFDAFLKSYDLLKKLNDEAGQAKVLTSLGGVLQRQGKFNEAIDALEKSAVIEEKLGNEVGQAKVLNSLGGVLQRQGKFDEAVSAFQKSYDISERLDDDRSLAMVLNSLGGVLQRQGKFDEAVSAFQKSYDISERLDDDRSLAMVLNSLGGVLSKQRKYIESENAFKSSITIGKRLKDKSHLSKVHTAFGKSLLAQNRHQDALIELQEGFEIDEALHNKFGMRIVTPALVNTLVTLGNKSEAIKICNRALSVTPKDNQLLQIQRQLMEKSNATQKSGHIKRLIKHDKGYLYGFIETDDKTPDIYFNERQVDRDLLLSLKEGVNVIAEVDMNEQRPRAKRVWFKEG